MGIRVRLCGMLRLIRVNTLRSHHNVGFLTRRLIATSVMQHQPQRSFRPIWLFTVRQLVESFKTISIIRLDPKYQRTQKFVHTYYNYIKVGFTTGTPVNVTL